MITSLGAALTGAYSVYGALLMNRWAITAASGRSFEATVHAAAEHGEGLSSAPGWIFGITGVVLALTWSILTWRRPAIPDPVVAGVWGLILAFGAPPYFFLSFGNLNTVGDVFASWSPDAALVLELPLYAVSTIALVTAMVVVIRHIAARPSRTS